MFDVLDRINELRENRGWTVYRIAKNSGIPQSSLSTWYAKQRTPPLDAIEKLCIAFDITLSEFFDDKKEDVEETKLERFRKEAGLSREELAKLTDIPVESICAYEQGNKDIGKAPYRTVERLAKALGCSIESIVGE